MTFNSLKDFFRVMSPEGFTASVGKKPTDRSNLNDILKEYILNHSGLFYTFDDISAEIQKHLTPGTAADEKSIRAEKDSQKKLFHAIGTSRIDLGDADYWDQISDIYGLVPELDQSTGEKPKVSVFSIRNPYVSPSTKGTQQIEFFLNHMPSIVVSQMVPYLDVEFHLRRSVSPAGKEYLDTPSVMRFLLGSKLNSDLTPGDQLLSKNQVYNINEKENLSKVSVTGMDLFLMPQTLTNMDSLGEQDSSGATARLVRAKPFVPFASIEGFDVNVQNAGAGSFAHKTASMKLKVHDKSRIGEMSEFFRGEVGYKQALIWTTYGWMAPQNRKSDEYADFINKNMLVRECWQVVNSQFSFDQSGQVSVNLQLVSSAARVTETLTVSEIDEDIKNFHRTVQWINELKKKAAGQDGKFSISVSAEQVLNAATTNGVFKDIDKMSEAIQKLSAAFRGTGNISESEINELEKNITSLTGENSFLKVSQKSAAVVKKKFDALARSETSKDPFLPVEGKKDYYPGARAERLIQEIKSYIALNSERNEAVEQPQGKLVKQHKKGSKTQPDSKKLTAKQSAAIAAASQIEDSGSNVTGDIQLVADVVSFGKLFTAFVAPSIMKTKNVDELQIFFYGFNDKCGLMSGMSLAEFPVNVKELALAYNDAVKRAGVDSLSVQAFLKLVIETQFVTKSSIGYGMNRFYKITEENGVRKNVIDDKDQDKRDGLEKFLAEFGTLTLPHVELYIESGERGTSGKDVIGNLKKTAFRQPSSDQKDVNNKNLIMRIHIYDRANNPYSLTQKIVNTGNGFEVGDVDTDQVNAFVKKLKESMSEASYVEIMKKFREDDRNYKEVLADDNFDYLAQNFDIIRRPGLETIQIPRDRKMFKEAIMQSVPSINIGTNGSLVLSINVASKTDGLMGAINLMNAKNSSPGRSTVSDNGLVEGNDLPLRVVPVQLTMSTLGLPIAQLYQTYFVDFNTGTSLDNIYSCSQLQHSISQGKFTTNMTFIYTDGYGKFGSTLGINAIIANQMETLLNKTKEVSGATQKPPAASGKSSGRPPQNSRKSGRSSGNTKK